MKLNRDITSKLRFAIDEFLPPIIRDSRFLMKLPFNILYSEKSNIFFNFKKNAFALSKRDFTQAYQAISRLDNRVTDLNKECEKKILSNIKGRTVLEIGCGKGYLAIKLSKKYKVSACDIVIDERVRKKNPRIQFRRANIESLPYKDKAFDTVVTTHTLEHVQNLWGAINELRRVTKKRLIVVVPKQRPYHHTFDLHLHFFPYIFSLEAAMSPGRTNKSHCRQVGGDFFYTEDFEKE